jgi:hypothetical protein
LETLVIKEKDQLQNSRQISHFPCTFESILVMIVECGLFTGSMALSSIVGEGYLEFEKVEEPILLGARCDTHNYNVFMNEYFCMIEKFDWGACLLLPMSALTTQR